MDPTQTQHTSTSETQHMSPADVHLHEQIMQAKTVLASLHRYSRYSFRMAAHENLRLLRVRQAQRFNEQRVNEGMTLEGIGEYWNRTGQFIAYEIKKLDNS